MRVAITDSGTGGLAVLADVEARLRRAPPAVPVELMYLNAAPEDDYSYNSMASRAEQLRTFDNFLRAARERYRPDLLFIACNTLSLLFRDPFFDPHRALPILGIVEAGARELERALEKDPGLSFILFATPTTIADGTYERHLRALGVPAERIARQACPGLPDAISNDAGGGLAADLLRRYVPEALAQFAAPPPRVAAFLGCTHYGYQARLFEQELSRAVGDVRILDPNRRGGRMVVDAIAAGAGPNGAGEAAVTVRVVSRYAFPAAPLASLPVYLGDSAPLTVAALRHFEHVAFFRDARGDG